MMMVIVVQVRIFSILFMINSIACNLKFTLKNEISAKISFILYYVPSIMILFIYDIK